MKKGNKFIAKKMTGGGYGDDGYYWKVINAKTRKVEAKNLSSFDAKSMRDRLNREDEELEKLAASIKTEADFFEALGAILR